VEKEASYTNGQGRLQSTSCAFRRRVKHEDWQILVNLATALRVPFDYASAAHVRPISRHVSRDEGARRI